MERLDNQIEWKNYCSHRYIEKYQNWLSSSNTYQWNKKCGQQKAKIKLIDLITKLTTTKDNEENLVSYNNLHGFSDMLQLNLHMMIHEMIS